jgi:hypothetical protein
MPNGSIAGAAVRGMKMNRDRRTVGDDPPVAPLALDDFDHPSSVAGAVSRLNTHLSPRRPESATAPGRLWREWRVER